MPLERPELSWLIKKEVLPTSLGSYDIRLLLSEELKDESIFSAKTTTETYLEKVKQTLIEFDEGIAQTKTPQGTPTEITEGLGRARIQMLEKLEGMGLVDRNTNGSTVESMTALGSKMRLNLILKTNEGLAASKAQEIRSKDPLQKVLNPAWRLVRLAYRNDPRGTHGTVSWEDRWNVCGRMVGWEGCAANHTVMVARKDSPIWYELGHYLDDSLGVDRPPFAFNSGMAWVDVSRKEALELGVPLAED